jgi:hypothetical protein
VIMNRINNPRRKFALAALLGCSAHSSINAYAQTPETPRLAQMLSGDSLSRVMIVVNANAYKVGDSHVVDLSWSGTQADKVDIYRDGSPLAGSSNNNGSYTDTIDRQDGGSYLYEVCEAGSKNCSNIAGVVF